MPIGQNAPDVVTAVVEIPQDGVNKYEYDKKLQIFRSNRNLHSPVHYPGDYLPRTTVLDFKVQLKLVDCPRDICRAQVTWGRLARHNSISIDGCVPYLLRW
jgi:hypothetical protein